MVLSGNKIYVSTMIRLVKLGDSVEANLLSLSWSISILMVAFNNSLSILFEKERVGKIACQGYLMIVLIS